MRFDSAWGYKIMPMNDTLKRVFSQVYDTPPDIFKILCKKLDRFGLSEADVHDAIKSACDFFNIPMPRAIHDMTDYENGQTMFVNWDKSSYHDDVICFDMRQLVVMNVDSKESFSLVMTHECAHRVFQATNFPGVAGGVWEGELAADFFIGVRAGLANMDESKIAAGLLMTGGCKTHPDGRLRVLFIRQGKAVAQARKRQGASLTIKSFMNEFMKLRNQNLDEIHRCQRRYFDF